MGIVFRILFSAVLTFLYVVLGVLFATGGGHGTVHFIWPLLTWGFFLAAFIGGNKLSTSAFLLLMGIHYTWILLFLWGISDGFDPNDIAYWENEPGIVVATTLVYSISQIAVWWAFFRNRQNKGKSG